MNSVTEALCSTRVDTRFVIRAIALLSIICFLLTPEDSDMFSSGHHSMKTHAHGDVINDESSLRRSSPISYEQLPFMQMPGVENVTDVKNVTEVEDVVEITDAEDDTNASEDTDVKVDSVVTGDTILTEVTDVKVADVSESFEKDAHDIVKSISSTV